MALRHLAKETCCRLGLSFSRASDGFLPSTSVFARAFAQVAEDLKYAKSHEWVKIEGDTATIGISDFAQEQLGDVVYVELPEKGTSLSKDESFGVVESVKTASDVYMPVGGEIIDANTGLSDSPDLINTGPYKDGWIVKVKMSDTSELDGLLDASAYATHIAD